MYTYMSLSLSLYIATRSSVKNSIREFSMSPGTEKIVRVGAPRALEKAVRGCCSRSLFENAGLGYTLL